MVSVGAYIEPRLQLFDSFGLAEMLGLPVISYFPL